MSVSVQSLLNFVKSPDSDSAVKHTQRDFHSLGAQNHQVVSKETQKERQTGIIYIYIIYL